MNEQVKAAALPTAVTPVGTNLIVSGWGTTSESNSNHLASVLYGSSINDVTQIYAIFTPHRHASYYLGLSNVVTKSFTLSPLRP